MKNFVTKGAISYQLMRYAHAIAFSYQLSAISYQLSAISYQLMRYAHAIAFSYQLSAYALRARDRVQLSAYVLRTRDRVQLVNNIGVEAYAKKLAADR
ncbi:hypothetical protein [Moorena sp. SIO2C4]|uniref:hypothetical protein n=1 Tax=Moorena sp. SIO2C4 TaxID=2607824 RepID=UPI0013C55BA6|nr:hypothetical protein [Moorena sp. SIO2C4]NES41467.1 hypothetical protein [Moorena sp. SIO2C4]